jgi:hypothetical protein
MALKALDLAKGQGPDTIDRGKLQEKLDKLDQEIEKAKDKLK